MKLAYGALPSPQDTGVILWSGNRSVGWGSSTAMTMAQGSPFQASKQKQEDSNVVVSWNVLAWVIPDLKSICCERSYRSSCSHKQVLLVLVPTALALFSGAHSGSSSALISPCPLGFLVLHLRAPSNLSSQEHL